MAQDLDRVSHVDQGLGLGPGRRPKVAVIGGGWAGLAAAAELSVAGSHVVVFEAAKQLGGRARGITAHGRRLDNGQHILLGAYRQTLRLMRMVGARPEANLKRVPLDLDYPGSLRLHLPRLPAPLNLAAGLLNARGCGLTDKLSAARFMRRLQSTGYRLKTDCSVAALLDRHEQRGVLRHALWDALCLAALNTAPENASAQVFANVLRDSLGGRRADTDLLLPTTDLSALFPEPAAAFVRAHGGEIRLSTRIAHIPPTLSFDAERFDDVILAVAPQHARTILSANPESAALGTLLAAYRYEPIGTVYLGYERTLRLPKPMLGLPPRGPESLGQWVFDRGALCGADGLISFVLSARGIWEHQDNDALAATLHDELQTLLGKKLPHPQWSQVIREHRASFSCAPDLARPGCETALNGLWLAGDYVCADYPATLESAVRSGVDAATRVLARHR